MGEPVRFEDSCTIGRVHIALPPEFGLRLFDAKKDRLCSAAGLSSEEIYAAWEAPGGKSLCAHYWPERATKEAVQIQAAREWECEAAGLAIRVAETEMFMGAPERLLAARFEIRRDGEYLICSKGLAEEAFEAILKSMRVS
jgi:hypothetical protein